MDWPGEKLLIKIVDSFREGIGVSARPWVIKRDGRAKAWAKAEARRIDRLSLEQLRQDVRDVKAGRKKLGGDLKLLEAPSSDSGGDETAVAVRRAKEELVNSLAAAGYGPHQLLEVERRINLEEIALLTAEEAANDESGAADEEPIDPDWFAQWRNRAQDVSREEMQRLWARVFKGEAKAGGSYSIHTLDFLSRMSRDDAELIAKMGVFALDGRWVYKEAPELLAAAGVSFDSLIYLQDVGLINGVIGLGGLSITASFQEAKGEWTAAVRNQNKALVFRAKTAEQPPLKFPCYTIARIGQELLTLAACEANVDYLKAIANTQREHCQSISLRDVLWLRGDDYGVGTEVIF
jgi:hypothetical protein